MIKNIVRFSDDSVFLHKEAIEQSGSNLFPGIYDVVVDTYGEFKSFKNIKIPHIYSLFPSKEISNIEDFITIIFSQEYEEFCKSSNILLKNGILLHGEAGIGKSNHINHIITRAVNEKEACVFNITSQRTLNAVVPILKELRIVQDNLFVIIFEEMDGLFLNSSGLEGFLKNFMDGINSLDNCLFLASTNYIDRIPVSLTERPSRFKKVFKIEPTEDVDLLKAWLVSVYRTFKPTITDSECIELHDLCINKTIDEIKHVIVDRFMNIQNISSKKKSIGFGFKAVHA